LGPYETRVFMDVKGILTGMMSKKIFYGWWISFGCFFIGLYVAGVVVFGFTAFFEPLIKEFGAGGETDKVEFGGIAYSGYSGGTLQANG
jgi:hypothetical protein